MNSKKTVLPGSERKALGTRVSDQPHDETIEISVILKPKERAPMPSEGQPPISREEFAAKFGASKSAVEKVEEFAKENDLKVTEVSPERRTIKLEGTAENMIR